MGSAQNQTVSSYRSDQTLISFFGRASYDYKQKILVNATITSEMGLLSLEKIINGVLSRLLQWPGECLKKIFCRMLIF